MHEKSASHAWKHNILFQKVGVREIIGFRNNNRTLCLLMLQMETLQEWEFPWPKGMQQSEIIKKGIANQNLRNIANNNNHNNNNHSQNYIVTNVNDKPIFLHPSNVIIGIVYISKNMDIEQIIEVFFLFFSFFVFFFDFFVLFCFVCWTSKNTKETHWKEKYKKNNVHA